VFLPTVDERFGTGFEPRFTGYSTNRKRDRSEQKEEQSRKRDRSNKGLSGKINAPLPAGYRNFFEFLTLELPQSLST
jgi:hypothetical protein